MSETIYFKENKDGNKIYKAEWLDDYDYESPREDRDNLGTMVFIKERSGAYGDEQVEDWKEYFLAELQKDEQIEVSGNQRFNCFSEHSNQNPKIEKYWQNERFDKEFFTQDMDSLLSNIKEELGEDVCENLSGGFSVDEDGVMTDVYEIDFSAAMSKRTSEDCSVSAQKILDAVYNKLHEELNIYPYVSSLDVKSELDSLSESQLFERWKNTKAAVLPINLYIHSGTTCGEATVRKTLDNSNNRDDGYIYNDGFVFVDKDSKEVQNELKGEARDQDGKVYNQWKPKTYEEAQKWAEGVLRAEIEDYASYLEGDVHTLVVSEFDPKTLSWNEEQSCSGILGSSVFNAAKDFGYSVDSVISEEKIKLLENSINPEFKAETAKQYIEEVKENLPDFDGNIKATTVSVSKVWAASKSPIKRSALNEYFKDQKLETPEQILNYLSEKTGLTKQEKSLPPISIQDKNIKAYIATIKNPNRSDNGGLAKLLLVDEKNKSFAYFNSPSYIVSKGDIYGKIINLGSGKHVEEKAKELARYGFKDVNVSNEYIAKYQKHFLEKDLKQDYQIER